MTSTIPSLVARKPSRLVRIASRFVEGIRETTDQIEPYTRWWDDQNQRAAAGTGPLLVAIGDSTAIGIGASSPDRSYVGVLQRSLSERDGTPWRVVNLALSGARLSDALDRQLPIAAELRADVVTCSIGVNDIVWTRRTGPLQERVRRLIAGLPPQSIVGRIAGGSDRSRLANEVLVERAAARGLPVVDPWREPGAPYRDRRSVDGYHPNDTGYELMARPFGRQLGLTYPGHPGDTEHVSPAP